MTPDDTTLGPVHDAITYACGWRWPVFPCRPGGKEPATPHGFHDATTDLDQLLGWWDNIPNANIGIRTGEASGLVVIDVDSFDHLPALLERVGPLPRTYGVWTPRGGLHAYYRHPGVRVKSTSGKIATGVDVRADGGYVIAAHSNVNGVPYEWRDDPYPGPPDLPALPAAWVELMNAGPRPVPDPDRVFTTAARPLAGVTGRTTGWVAAALRGELEAVATAKPGTRNDRLNGASFRCGQLVAAGVVDRDGIFESLHAAARSCGLGPSEADRTIVSGISAGQNSPAVLPQEPA